MAFIKNLFSSKKGSGFEAKLANVINPVSADQLANSQANVNAGLGQQQGFLNPAGGFAQAALANQANLYGQQQDLANQYAQIAQGQGPNPAAAMLNQATGQNVAAQAALMAGQRGANANAGLLARQAAMQGGALQQNAVGQAANMQAQQQLGALQSLGQQQANMANLAAQQVGQYQTGLNAYNQFAGQNQQTLLGAQTQFNNQAINNQSNVNSVQGQIAAGNQKSQTGMFGGLLNAAGAGVGALMGGSEGAKIGGSLFAEGGMVPGPQSMLGQALMNSGGVVPGKAQVAGNSYSNDKVPAMLSPGEIVIPRSVVNSDNPAANSAAFVAQVMAKKKGRLS